MKYPISFLPNFRDEKKSFSASVQGYPEYTLFNIGKESYIVKGMVENSDEGHSKTGKMIHNLQIGRYCSIAEDVYFLIGRGKNYKRVTTSNARVLHLGADINNNYCEKGSIIIENDVWIGRKVSIMSGVTVHNGAIIGANSHVIKDVPPYAIVGGNPAKVIGYRFEPEIIDKLQMIQWWYWDDEKIYENAEFFNDDIETFCNKFYMEAEETFRNKYSNLNTGEKDSYMMVVDVNDNYAVLEFVLDEFIRNYFHCEQKQLVLFVMSKSAEEEYITKLKEIINNICNEPKMKASICIETGDMEDAKKCLAAARHLIINRMPCTVELMCFSEMFKDKIEILSGVDSRIFKSM